jgi:hypothetical protein
VIIIGLRSDIADAVPPWIVDLVVRRLPNIETRYQMKRDLGRYLFAAGCLNAILYG